VEWHKFSGQSDYASRVNIRDKLVADSRLCVSRT